MYNFIIIFCSLNVAFFLIFLGMFSLQKFNNNLKTVSLSKIKAPLVTICFPESFENNRERSMNITKEEVNNIIYSSLKFQLNWSYDLLIKKFTFKNIIGYCFICKLN